MKAESTAIASSWAEAIRLSTNLTELENIVTKGRSTFLEVGLALARIHDAKLYKATHSRFEDYCRDRWGWGRMHASRWMDAANVVQNLSQVGYKILPAESHARPLAALPPDEQPDAWKEVIETAAANGVTAEHVRAIVEKRLGTDEAKQKPQSLQTRRTPRWFFDLLNIKFGPFVLDAFAEPHNAMCGDYYTREQDGCAQPWADATFANPEFEGMAEALRQAVDQAELGMCSCVLGPVGCSQEWYHQLAIQGTIWVPDKRISYNLPDGSPTNGADRDSIVMTFGREHANPWWRKGEFRVRRLEIPEHEA